MNIVYLCNENEVPSEDSWTEYAPIKIAYIDDINIIEFKKKYLQYAHIIKFIYDDIFNILFFTIPYVCSNEDNTYCVKTIVKLKKHIPDYNVKIVTTEQEFNTLVFQKDHILFEEGVHFNVSHLTNDSTFEKILIKK